MSILLFIVFFSKASVTHEAFLELKSTFADDARH